MTHVVTFFDACKTQDQKKMKQLIRAGRANLAQGILGAAEGGHTKAMESMITELGESFSDWGGVMIHASVGGHEDIVDMAITKHKPVLREYPMNTALTRALGQSHTNICRKLLLKISPHQDMKAYMYFAIESGNPENVRLILDVLIDNHPLTLPLSCFISIWLKQACELGNKEVVELFVDKAKDDARSKAEARGRCYLSVNNDIDVWNQGLLGACKGGHLDIVERMIENGANNWTQGLRQTHSPVIARLMLDKGAPIVMETCEQGIKNGHVNLVKVLLGGPPQFPQDWNVWDKEFTIALERGHVPMCMYMIRHGYKKEIHSPKASIVTIIELHAQGVAFTRFHSTHQDSILHAIHSVIQETKSRLTMVTSVLVDMLCEFL